MKGVVVKFTGIWYQVYIYEKDLELEARLKGIFRTEGSRDTNPIAVGDIVSIETELGDYVISEIELCDSPEPEEKSHAAYHCG